MHAFDISLFAESQRTPEDLSTAFYEHFDGLVSRVAGRLKVQVVAEGSSGLSVALSTICSLEEKLPLRIVAIDPDLVDIPEIAKRVDKSRQAVQQWVTNVDNAFPAVIGNPGGKRIWAWSQVQGWLRGARPDLADPWFTLSRDEAVQVECWLIDRRGLYLAKSQLASTSAVVMIGSGSLHVDRPSAAISMKVVA